MALIAGIRYFDQRPLSPAEEAFSGDQDIQWDGRLDNCAEPPRDPSQFAGLVGDWSVALWNRANRTLLLASDYAGARPLYYSHSPQRVVWSSSLAALSAWLGKSEIDRDYVSSFLAIGGAADRTPYRDIQPVPPGCLLRITAAGLQRERLWNPPVDQETTLPSDRDYEQRLRDLFREAVKVRLSQPGPVVAELSGGLDSTAVVCMARQLIESGEVAATSLSTVGYRERGSTDSAFIDGVEAACGVPALHLDLERYGFASPQATGVGAPAWWTLRHTEVARHMTSLGATTLLTGQTGDLVMGNWLEGTEHIADELSHLRVGSALGAAARWARAGRQSIYPILWGAAKSAIDPGAIRPGRRTRLTGLIEILKTRHLQTPESLRPAVCSHAFTHRPLVEFMLTIPPAIVYSPGEPRRLMRRALADLLPKVVLHRRSKAGYNDVFRQSLVPMAQSLLAETTPLLLAEHGFVDAEVLRGRLQQFTNGLECNEAQLRNILLMEYWLRNREGVLNLDRQKVDRQKARAQAA